MMTAIRSPRHRRVLDRLAAGNTLTSLGVQRVAGCVSSSSLISRLRQRYGLRLIPTVTRHTDMDNRPTRIANYALTPAERERVRRLLAEG